MSEDVATPDPDAWGGVDEVDPIEEYWAEHSALEVLPSRKIPKYQVTNWLAKGATTWSEVGAKWRRRAVHEVKSLPWTLVQVLVWLPTFLAAVTRHTWIGRGLAVGYWWTWVTCNDYMAPLLQQNMDKGRAVSAEEIEEGRKPTQTPTQRAAELYRHRRSRWLLTLFGLFVLGNLPWCLDVFAPGSNPMGIPWTPSLYWAYLWLSLGVCEEIGRRFVPEVEEDDGLDRKVLLHPNIPIGQLRKGIEVFFEAYGFRLKLTTTDVDPHYFRFGYYCPQELTDTMLRQLERSLGAAPKSVKRMVDRGDSSTGELMIRISDPLAEFVACPKANPPKQRDILKPLPLGPCEDGTTTGVTFAGAHTIIAGQTGSGKSGLTNVVVERISDCFNAELYCIDPTDGPDSQVLSGFYSEFDKRKVQTSWVQADALLDWLLAECTRRNQEVNRRIAAVRPDPETGKVPSIPRNHIPTAEDPHIFVVIEEFPQLKSWPKEITQKVERLHQIGRKGCIGCIIVTQSTTKTNGLGSMVIQNQCTVRLIGSTKPGELLYAIGQGAAEQGFHPETLIPATKHAMNDAGKFYALSSDRWEPVLTRAYGLEFEDIIERVFERTGNWDDSVLELLDGDFAPDRDGDGIPDDYDEDPDDATVVRLDKWVYDHADAEEPDASGASGEAADSPPASPPPTSGATPPLLELLMKVAKDTGYTRIPTRWILTELAATPGPWKSWDANKLGEALRSLGMPRSTQLGKGPWGKSSKGYRQADVEAVIAGTRFD